MDVDQSFPTPPASGPGGPPPLLRYDGRAGEIYPIFLLNLLLTIITLGIFRFWAVTRMRRYLWSRVAFQDQRLTYTGTGGELFVGFLLAGLVLIGLAIVAGMLAFILRQVDERLTVIPVVLFYFAIIVLAFGAVFSAQRYRLSRTEWCGIRGGMRGSMLAYGLRSVLYWLLVPLTLYQLIPWVQFRLAERRINASSFGSAQFRAQFKASRVYGRFLLTLLGVLLLAGVIVGVDFVAAGSMVLEVTHYLQAMHSQGPDGASDSSVRMDIMMGAAYLVLAFSVLVFIVGAMVIGAIYQACVLRHMADNTALGPMQMSGRFTAGGLLGLTIGNLLIIVFTLGLGYPFALNRYARYVCANLRATGSLDPATLAQSDQRVPRFGEGMFQQLDAGGGVF